ncbi:type II secretion system protein [Nocardioides sp. LHD-245]|uniref:type IV pilus modification PilV family protein n=1 Tax=Nocardioides sp. LHD-245 TaxID=3051387 RepID=UPI0027E03B93|nr:type II secretion system protein [Nocardioides sp. LHD-245]
MDLPGRLTRDRSDAGATLIEVLVALSILSIAAVAILAGVEMSIKTSDIHRKQSTGGAYVRNYAEAVQAYVADDNYVPCAGAGAYAAAVIGFDVPAGYSATQEASVPLRGDGSEDGCPGGDSGVQRLTLRMRSDDGRSTEVLTVVVRDPCAPGDTSC